MSLLCRQRDADNEIHGCHDDERKTGKSHEPLGGKWVVSRTPWFDLVGERLRVTDNRYSQHSGQQCDDNRQREMVGITHDWIEDQSASGLSPVMCRTEGPDGSLIYA